MKDTYGTVFILFALAILFAVLLLALPGEAAEGEAVLIPPLVIVCQEDMPCWDCETMGDKICGPIAEPEIKPTAHTHPPQPATKVYAAGLVFSLSNGARVT